MVSTAALGRPVVPEVKKNRARRRIRPARGTLNCAQMRATKPLNSRSPDLAVPIATVTEIRRIAPGGVGVFGKDGS